ncbi:MAG: transcriptional regulator NrdR [Candidatus Dojkabacteria bacterium]|jgi:transcriptional repressor NrdR
MKCPFCECENTKVVDKRDNRDDGTTRRRRQCLRCSKRFTTYERVESIDVSIVKKDGSLEKFDSQKVSKSIRKAANLDKISDDDIEEFTESIERLVLNSEEPITSNQIGLLILDWLKKRDQLAYIRFASVYKNFQGLDDITEEIKSLEKI